MANTRDREGEGERKGGGVDLGRWRHPSHQEFLEGEQRARRVMGKGTKFDTTHILSCPWFPKGFLWLRQENWIACFVLRSTFFSLFFVYSTTSQFPIFLSPGCRSVEKKSFYWRQQRSSEMKSNRQSLWWQRKSLLVNLFPIIYIKKKKTERLEMRRRKNRSKSRTKPVVAFFPRYIFPMQGSIRNVESLTSDVLC